MKFIKMMALCSFMILSNQFIFADEVQIESRGICIELTETNCDTNTDCCTTTANFGTASFSVTDPTLWYPIDTNSYPTTTPLSMNRNRGVTDGRVYLSPTGFTIGEAGNYWVTITAVLQNNNVDTLLIPVFLVRDETFDPTDPSLVGGVVTLPTGELNTVQATGTLKDVVEGTRFSLVGTNAGYPSPKTISVVSWSISLHKLP